MARLEELTTGTLVKGIAPEATAELVSVKWHGSDVLEVVYKDSEGRRGTVGFALTSLQRRLASSPEAIYQSLRRRRERLEKRLREEQLLRRGAAFVVPASAGQTAAPSERRRSDRTDPAKAGAANELPSHGPTLTPDDLDDLDDAPDAEVEDTENQIIDQATAAQTIAELEKEIAILRRFENLALEVRRSGKDRKWDELSALLQNNQEMFDPHGHRRKLVLFTEDRDTLNYLAGNLRTLLGQPEAVVLIHGSLGREERTKSQELFTQDKDVQILVATDAAGEGINLQRAHLMVNYDLPWNPNRIEQRFGRIHRIELLAMQAVMAAERALGFEPTDVSADHRGYDVESRIPNTGTLRFLEVKGRAVGADTVTLTRNEIMTALNKPEDFILAIVTVDGEAADPRYVREPFQREPDYAVTSVDYELAGLLSRATPPT